MEDWLKGHELSLSEQNPLLVGLLAANEDHLQEIAQLFCYMHNLRHVGFPTPSIDWTKNRLIAAFFAASIQANMPIAIFRLKIQPTSNTCGLNIYRLDPEENLHLREIAQESVYTISLFQYVSDTQVHKDKKTGPYYCLHSYERLSEFVEELKIEKYIIIDSSDRKNRLNILKELYENNINFEKIYGNTDLLENTVIKDVAIKSILFGEKNLFKQAEMLSREHLSIK